MAQWVDMLYNKPNKTNEVGMNSILFSVSEGNCKEIANLFSFLLYSRTLSCMSAALSNKFRAEAKEISRYSKPENVEK